MTVEKVTVGQKELYMVCYSIHHTSTYHRIQRREKRLVKAIDGRENWRNDFRNLHDIRAITGVLLKNYFDDKSLDTG
jgi:ribosomal protein S4